MRSILLDRSRHFFKILEYDKSEWFDFWRNNYRKFFPRVVPLYEKKHNLDDGRIKRILSSFSRPFLDGLKLKIYSNLKDHKKSALEKINRYSGDLKLNREDFHMMIITLLGLNEVTFIRTEKRGLVVLIDPLAMEMKGRFQEFDHIVLESAKNARRMLDNP